MTEINQWLLPDGIEDVLPKQAMKMESLRRQALDLFHSWGYDLKKRENHGETDLFLGLKRFMAKP